MPKTALFIITIQLYFCRLIYFQLKRLNFLDTYQSFVQMELLQEFQHHKKKHTLDTYLSNLEKMIHEHFEQFRLKKTEWFVSNKTGKLTSLYSSTVASSVGASSFMIRHMASCASSMNFSVLSEIFAFSPLSVIDPFSAV